MALRGCILTLDCRFGKRKSNAEEPLGKILPRLEPVGIYVFCSLVSAIHQHDGKSAQKGCIGTGKVRKRIGSLTRVLQGQLPTAFQPYQRRIGGLALFGIASDRFAKSCRIGRFVPECRPQSGR